MLSCDLGLTADSKHGNLPEPRCNGLTFCVALPSICFLDFYCSACSQRLHCIWHESKTRNETRIPKSVTMQCCQVAAHIHTALLHDIKLCAHCVACNFLARNPWPHPWVTQTNHESWTANAQYRHRDSRRDKSECPEESHCSLRFAAYHLSVVSLLVGRGRYISP